MPEFVFLLDADMPRSSAKVISNLGFQVEDVREDFLKELDRRIKGLQKTMIDLKTKKV